MLSTRQLPGTVLLQPAGSFSFGPLRNQAPAGAHTPPIQSEFELHDCPALVELGEQMPLL